MSSLEHEFNARFKASRLECVVSADFRLDGFCEGVFEVDFEVDIFDTGCTKFIRVAIDVEVCEQMSANDRSFRLATCVLG